MYSFDSPTTRRGEVFLIVTYHFVPISASTGTIHSSTNSMLSPLDTRGQGCIRASSPASSGTPSPVSASSSLATRQPQSWQVHHCDGNLGYEQIVYRTTHSPQAYSHPHSQARTPQVSVQAPTPTVSQAGALMNPVSFTSRI